MSKKPYPGPPPNYRSIRQTGGYFRTCIVIELLSLELVGNEELAYIQEQLEAVIDRVRVKTHNIEKVDVVLPDRFDPLLKEGLRLSEK